MRITKSIYTYLIALILLFGSISCNTYNRSLNIVFEEIQARHSDIEINDFRITDEDSLLRYRDLLSNDLLDIFEINKNLESELSIENLTAPYRNYVLIKAFHRKVNNKDIEYINLIEEARELFKDSYDWQEKIESCKFEKKKNAETNFNEFEIGEVVSINLPVFENDGIRNAVFIGCGTDNYVDISTKEILVLTGKLTEKYSKTQEGELDYFFVVNLQEISDNGILFLLNKISVGQDLVLNLNLFGELI